MSYKHFSIDEWVVLKELLISQKSNPVQNKIYKISNYNSLEAHKKYLKNRKKSFKNIKLSYKELQYLNEKFTKFHWLSEIICYQYKKDFGVIFSVCFETLYKYIKLGLFGLNKRNTYFKVKNCKTVKHLYNEHK